jgi:hypothetical protein
MVARKSPEANRKYKTQYRVKNWAAYEPRRRGESSPTLSLPAGTSQGAAPQGQRRGEGLADRSAVPPRR